MLYIESLNSSLHEIMQENEGVYMIGEDIVDPYGGAFKVTKGLSSKYSGRVLSSPISEAAILGIGTGMAIQGFKPIVEIMFGDFITLCADQIINGATKFRWMYGDNFNVPLVIRTPMGGNRGYGATHSQTIENIFFSVPHLKIVSPSIFHNPGKLLSNSVLHVNMPVLFIENKILYPMELLSSDNSLIKNFIFNSDNHSDDQFPTIILKTDSTESPDLSIITYGGMAKQVVSAVEKKFMEDEASIRVIIPSIIKPLPHDDIISNISGSKKILIVEEGSKYSGWGAELSCLIYDKIHGNLEGPIHRIGAKQSPIPSSSKLEKSILPQEKDIANMINNIIS
tara:strand:+ start:71939 stop:72955 length:1017 start_codon:yes stop_codon:yes gene_type:complete